MTIRDIIVNGRGTAGPWTVERHGTQRTLIHYGTRMLTWTFDRSGKALMVDYSEGWGSVSDQNGMNTAFRALGLPYRFDRDRKGGGPRVTELKLWPCGHCTDPSVDHRSCPTLLDMMLSGVA